MKIPNFSLQHLGFGVAFLLFLGGIGYVLFEKKQDLSARRLPQKKFPTFLNTAPPEERWVARIEKQNAEIKKWAQDVQKSAQEIKDQHVFLEKRLETMEGMLSSYTPSSQRPGAQRLDPQRSGSQPTSASATPVESVFSSKEPFYTQEQSRLKEQPHSKESHTPDPAKKPAKIFVSSLASSLEGAEAGGSKNVDTYIPAGTHARGVLISGLTAYTGTSSVSDPEPIKIRLIDYGVIAKGFRGDIKDAVLLGACYGELSSERARCRLHTLTLEEDNGEIIETPVEGWVMGEDGRSGIRGEVIDRAGEVARSALLSGILGGIGSFFQQQSQRPMSLLGQTSPLKGRALMEGAGASGASNAFEKLADYTIKRAEKMEPVIVVDAGRRIDVLFKKGFDLSGTMKRQTLERLGLSQRASKVQTEHVQLGIGEEG